MEPILSTLDKAATNQPHDMLSRLYREIGISAVAAALEISKEARGAGQSIKDRRERFAKKAA